MRVLVTGGTGYLGGAIVRALKARGHEPVVFARSATKSAVDAERIDGDIRDLQTLENAMRGCEAVCHTAALVAVWRRQRSEFDEINVGGLENVLTAASSRDLSRVIYTSSFLALPPTGAQQPVMLNDYQRTKVIADGDIRRAISNGARAIAVYPGVIYGPGPRTEGNLLGGMIADHLAGKLPGIIGADRLWSFSFVDDVAEGHVAALENGRIGSRYILGGENLAQIRPFEFVREKFGRPLPRRIPFAAAALVGFEEQVRASLFGTSPLLTVGTARILEHDWAMDSSLAGQELGYKPRSLADGMGEMLAEVELK